MIDVSQVMERDQLVQYLAFYTVTKGLMVQLDVDKMQKLFIEYKLNLMKGEYSLQWLTDEVMMKYGIPPEKLPLNPHALAGSRF